MDDQAAAELYIDTGDREENKRIFDGLAAKRGVIEQAFGGELLWERLEEKRACRVRYLMEQGGLSSGEDRWPKIQDAMVEAMERLAKALTPHLLGSGV